MNLSPTDNEGVTNINQLTLTQGLSPHHNSKQQHGTVIWGFPAWGYPNSWMVDFKEIPTKMDDLGVPPTSGNIGNKQLQQTWRYCPISPTTPIFFCLKCIQKWLMLLDIKIAILTSKNQKKKHFLCHIVIRLLTSMTRIHWYTRLP